MSPERPGAVASLALSLPRAISSRRSAFVRRVTSAYSGRWSQCGSNAKGEPQLAKLNQGPAKRSRYIDGDVQDAIQRLAVEKPAWSPAQIMRELERQGLPGLPSLRTFQNHVRRVRPTDPSGPWSLAGAIGDEAAIVLEVLAGVIESTE